MSGNWSALGGVLSSPYVPRLLSAALIGRLPTGMAALAIVLVVRDGDGTYALAGILTALYSGSAAVCGPVLGRLVDLTRQPPVLLSCATASATGFLILAITTSHQQWIGAGAAAILAGGTTPQLEPCLRVLWGEVVTGERQLRAAFSLDAATQELIFIGGPLLVLAATGYAGPAGGLVAAAVVCLVGTYWFASARPARQWRAVEQVKRHWLGPLRAPGVARLFMVVVCVGLTVGAFTIGITGYAEAYGDQSWASWLIASNAIGALLGGLVYTAMPIARHEDRRLLVVATVLASGYLPLTLVPAPPVMMPLALLSGIALPAVLASMFAIIAAIAPQGTLTEAHAWMITSFGVGYALGSAIAGVAVDTMPAPAPFMVAAIAGIAAVGLAVPRMIKPAPGKVGSAG